MSVNNVALSENDQNFLKNKQIGRKGAILLLRWVSGKLDLGLSFICDKPASAWKPFCRVNLEFEMRYSTISFAVLLASTALFANAATTAPHFISGDVVIDSSDFQKPATDKYNIDYYKIVNGNQLTFTGSGNTSGSLTVRNDDNDRVN